jgi:hypothetical protein
MTKHTKESMLELWYQALASPYGVEIQCQPDFESVRQKLYRTRLDAQDDDLKALAICQSPFDPQLLWLVRKEGPDAGA